MATYDTNLPEKYYLAALASVNGLGAAALARLVAFFPSPVEAWGASVDLLREAGLGEQQAQEAVRLSKTRPDYPAEIAENCERRGINIVGLSDDDYPPLLREIYSPPAVLYYRGELEPEAHRLAIVGSRRQTAYGKRAAEMIGRDLAAAGVTVVSGAAYGIDASAHRGALAAGRTVAVLGCGVDVAYPATHRQLIDEIAERGAIVSEYPPGTRPVAGHFPARNRIISGLAYGTVVVEAAERSGSLITAELALSDGRDVFAVPGSIFSDLSRGTNRLIQNGAKLIYSAADVLAEYPFLAPPKTDKAATAKELPLSPEEKIIYDILTPDQPLAIDEIICRLHGRADVSNTAFILLQLEMRGLVASDDSQAYTRTVI